MFFVYLYINIHIKKNQEFLKICKKDLIFKIIYCIIIKSLQRGVAKFGIALGSGPRGRGFKSRHSDHAEYH